MNFIFNFYEIFIIFISTIINLVIVVKMLLLFKDYNNRLKEEKDINFLNTIEIIYLFLSFITIFVPFIFVIHIPFYIIWSVIYNNMIEIE